MHQIQGEVEFITMSGGFLSFEIAFEIRFEIPHWVINEEASYRFRVTLQRTGTPAFNDTRDFPSAAGATFHNRLSYRIIASPVTHLRHDGNRVADSDMHPAFFYLGSDVGHMLDWMDWSQLYSGFVHYNRLYPLRHSVANIVEWGIWVNGTMHNGINSDDEVRDMLEVLEYTRRDINEGGGDYDFMLGIVDRNEVVGSQSWAGITSDAYRSALISVGNDTYGDPAYDVGAIIAHELLHQHSIHHQSDRELAQSDKDGWNSVSGDFIRDPVTLMYVPAGGGSHLYDWNDETAFAEGRYDSTDGSYDRLYDALANPHPVSLRVRERVLKAVERPVGTTKNFTLIGHYSRAGGFVRVASWIGRGDTPVTPDVADGEGVLIFADSNGNELLRWCLRFTFGLRAVDRTGHASTTGEASATVSVTCPWPTATAHVVLMVDKQIVWQADVPSAGPAVQLITPSGGQIAPTDQVIVEWQASHPQGLALEYRVSYSSDGGKTFRPLAVAVKETRYEWQFGLGASGGRIRLRVVASDGFNQAEDISDDIQVEDVARRIAIIQPHRGEVIPEGRTIRLAALANDLEQGALSLNPANTRWLLDGEIILGSGNEIEVKEIELTTPRGVVTTPLPVGAHRLSVELMLGAGKTLRDEIPIEIAADSDRDGVPDDVEIERGTDPNDPGDRSTIAPIYPFGQWRFHRCRNHTLFQIAHLLAGTVVIELGFIDENGAPLANHMLQLVRGTGRTNVTTGSDGWARIEIGSLQSVLLKVAGNDNTKRDSAFGTCRLRVAKGSPLTETILQAHAWISRHRGCWWLGRESQGTVVINCGKPLTIRGAKKWKGSSPKMATPILSYRLLGRLQMATRRLSRGLVADVNSNEKAAD